MNPNTYYRRHLFAKRKSKTWSSLISQACNTPVNSLAAFALVLMLAGFVGGTTVGIQTAITSSASDFYLPAHHQKLSVAPSPAVLGASHSQPLEAAVTIVELVNSQPQVLGDQTYQTTVLFQASNLTLSVTPNNYDASSGKWDYQVSWKRLAGRNGSVYINGQQVSAQAYGQYQVSTGSILSPNTRYQIIFYSQPDGKGGKVAVRYFVTLPAPDQSSVTSKPTQSVFDESKLSKKFGIPDLKKSFADAALGTISSSTRPSSTQFHISPAVAGSVISGCVDISTSGNYTLGGRDVLVKPTANCLEIHDTSNVNLDCQGHSLIFDASADHMSSAIIEFLNVTNFSVNNCTFKHTNVTAGSAGRSLEISHSSQGTINNSSFGSPQDVDIEGYVNITDSNNLQFTRNNFYASFEGNFANSYVTVDRNNFKSSGKATNIIAFASGSYNKFTNNIIDGSWDGDLSQDYQHRIGADDGIVIGYENNDVVQGNIIKNVWDCGFEADGWMFNSQISDNQMSNIGYCGLGAWYGNSFKGNTVSNNTADNAPALLAFFRIGGLVSPAIEHGAETNVYFKDNSFTNNKLTNPRILNQAYIDQQTSSNINMANISLWPGEATVPDQNIILGNNVFTGNDFSTVLAAPTLLPKGMIVDGGNNICSSVNAPSDFPLKCLGATQTVHPAGTLITKTDNTVFIISSDQKGLYGFTNSDVFLSWGLSFSKVIAGNSADNALPARGLISAYPCGGKYTGTQLITDMEKVMQGQNICANITGVHPGGTLINNNGTVQIIASSQKGLYGFPSPDSFSSWGLSFASVIPGNSADDNLPQIGVVPSRPTSEPVPTSPTDLIAAIERVLAGGGGGGGNPNGVSAISKCQDITQNGNYILNKDINAIGNGCLTVKNVTSFTLNCNNHAVILDMQSKQLTEGRKPILGLSNVKNFSITACNFKVINIGQAPSTVTIDNSSDGIISNSSFYDPNATAIGTDDSSVVFNNTTRVKFSGNTVNGVFYENSSNNSTIENNSFLPTLRILKQIGVVVSSGKGDHNTFHNNIIDGKWDGSDASLHIGADDGLTLNDESYDTISGNTIRNNWECGIETTGLIQNTLFLGNKITKNGFCGIGAWYYNIWKTNTVGDNIIDTAPYLFQFFREYSLRPGEDAVYFTDNVFRGNSFINPTQGISAVFSLQPLGGGIKGPADTTPYVVRNNQFSNNNFNSQLRAPGFFPPFLATDGGGNICGAPAIGDYPNIADFPLHCQGAATTVPPVVVATPTSLSFSAAAGANPSAQYMTLLASGTPVSINATTDQPWLSALFQGSDGGVLLPLHTLYVTVTTGSLAPASYTGHVIVTGNFTNSPLSIPVTFTITSTPAWVTLTTPQSTDSGVTVNVGMGSQNVSSLKLTISCPSGITAPNSSGDDCTTPHQFSISQTAAINTYFSLKFVNSTTAAQTVNFSLAGYNSSGALLDSKTSITSVAAPHAASGGNVYDYTGSAIDGVPDGKVDSSDVTYLLRVVTNIVTCPSGKTCDVNGDGAVNTLDLIALQKLVNNNPFDYNSDGVVDSSDVTYLLRVVTNIVTCPAGKTCDVNGDGAVNTLDLIKLQQIIAAG